MTGAWKDKPDEVFDLVREVAIEWRTVELADKHRHRPRAGRAVLRGKSFPTPPGGTTTGGRVDKPATEVVTCFECKKPGHLARNCPLNSFPVQASAPPYVGRGNGGPTRGSFLGAWAGAAAAPAAAAAAA